MELILMTAVIIFLAIFVWSHQTDARLPPHPRRPLPIVGNLFYMGVDPRSQYKTWRKQCGDIFSVNIMGTLIVVLNGFDVIKEALMKEADSFSDRTPVFIDEVSGLPGKGLLYSSGDNWKEQRSITLNILKKFGMGKNILAEKIQEEVSAYVNYLASKKEEHIDIKIMTNISMSNIICSILIGHRFQYDDKEFQEIMSYLRIVSSDMKNVCLANFIPWLKYLPGDLFSAKKCTRNVQAMFDLLRRFIVEKGHNSLASGNVENFINAYNVEKNKKLTSGEPTYMDDANLHKIILDLFYAGTETTSTTICWFILYMVNFPDVQEKVFNEIKETVGTYRTPTMLDRPKLPYLNAAILETQRLASVAPHALAHTCSEDATLRGYTIPKETFIIPNLDSVLHDKIIWGEDVMAFKPERFLDANGKLKDREEMIPFGIGRRVCPGEAIVKMELFLFLSNLFQQLRVIPKDEVAPDCTRYNFGIVCSPLSYEVRVLMRS